MSETQWDALLREPLSDRCSENIRRFSRLYGLPRNRDLVIRPFLAGGVECVLMYLQGMASERVIGRFILTPLMECDTLSGEPLPAIRKRLAAVGEVEEASLTGECSRAILDGRTLLLCEGSSTGLLLETRGYAHRPVDKTVTESVVQGPQEGFVESLRDNITLLRRIVRSEKLIGEMLTVGTRLPTQLCLMYLDGAADPACVRELKRRVLSLNVASCPGTGALMQLIEDNPFAPFPQMLETERPDRAARCLADGQLVLLCDGSPYVLAAPVTLFHLLHATDDCFMRWQYGTFLRLIRLLGLTLSLLLPGFYLALSLHHPHMLPMELLTAIAETRAKVPFPIPVEVMVMELSFCLINEAGTRIPSLIGPTVGIVGALILGQAAVAASVISPILIIVVALTGLGNYAVPNYSVSVGVQLLRLGFIACGALLGMYGLMLGMTLLLTSLCAMRSLDRPFMAPAAPWRPHNPDLVLRFPLWMQTRRLFLSRRAPSAGPVPHRDRPVRGWKEGSSPHG